MSRISDFMPIEEALGRVSIEELEKELKVDQKYLFNYLGQLLNNISEEVGPNVFVAPFTFGG
jgi:hypothetical protein